MDQVNLGSGQGKVHQSVEIQFNTRKKFKKPESIYVILFQARAKKSHASNFPFKINKYKIIIF